MSSKLRRVREFIDAWKRHGLEESMGFLAEDCVYHNMPVEPARGSEATRAMLEGCSSMASRVEWGCSSSVGSPAAPGAEPRADSRAICYEFGARSLSGAHPKVR